MLLFSISMQNQVVILIFLLLIVPQGFGAWSSHLIVSYHCSSHDWPRVCIEQKHHVQFFFITLELVPVHQQLIGSSYGKRNINKVYQIPL